MCFESLGGCMFSHKVDEFPLQVWLYWSHHSDRSSHSQLFLRWCRLTRQFWFDYVDDSSDSVLPRIQSHGVGGHSADGLCQGSLQPRVIWFFGLASLWWVCCWSWEPVEGIAAKRASWRLMGHIVRWVTWLPEARRIQVVAAGTFIYGTWWFDLVRDQVQ